MRKVIRFALYLHCMGEYGRLSVREGVNPVEPNLESEDFDRMTDIAVEWIKDALKVW